VILIQRAKTGLAPRDLGWTIRAKPTSGPRKATRTVEDLRHRFPNSGETAGAVVGVKSQIVEAVETIAERIRLLLISVQPATLPLVPDCGFGQAPFFPAFRRLCHLVQAAVIIRRGLAR
jgi:hypothetical protein